jgi:hypothetical protein
MASNRDAHRQLARDHRTAIRLSATLIWIRADSIATG